MYDTMYIRKNRGASMTKSQVVKWGNSLAVRIPKSIAQEARLREGDSLVIEVHEEQVNLRRVDDVPTLQELVARITPENRYSEVSSAVDTGRESIEW